MRKFTSLFLAITMFFTSMGLNGDMIKAFASDDVDITSVDSSQTTSGAAVKIEPTMAVTTSSYTRGSEQITFAKAGTETNPVVRVTVDTQGLEIAGITYERGYNRTAKGTSKRIYGHEEKSGIVTFDITNVNRYISVMIALYDSSTKKITTIENKYELTGKRVYNSGSGSFSAYPEKPLNNSTNKDTLVGDQVSTLSGGDNGPLLVVDDEIWVFTNSGNLAIFKMDNIDEYFYTSTNIPSENHTLGRTFNEVSATAIYDGRYVIVNDGLGYLAVVDASTPDRTKYTVANVSSIFSNYTTNNLIYGNVSALAYDNENLYVLTSGSRLYRAVRQADGKYVFDANPLNTGLGVYGSTIGNDMVYDGRYLWIARNSTSLIKYDTTNNSFVPVSVGNYVSRIIYDGNKYLYAMGIQGLYTGTKSLWKIDKDTNAYTEVYTDMVHDAGAKEDFNFDGRNIWVHAYYGNDGNRYRYDTVDGAKEEIPTVRWFNGANNPNSSQTALDRSSIGVYDGKYQWSWVYTYQRINVVGHLIDLNYGPGAKGTNLEKFFADNPSVANTTTVYVDDKDTTQPNYVDAKVKKGYSTSKIVYGAWTYDSTQAGANTRNSAFFADLSKYVDDESFGTDWTKYRGLEGSYFAFDKDELPTVNSDKSFDFNFRTLPKQNGYYTLYMINDEYRPYIETVYVDNYKEIAKLYITFEDKDTGEIVIRNMDESFASGSTATIKADKYLADLAAQGYILADASSKTIKLDAASNEVTFQVSKDKTKWTEIIKKPYYINGSGVKTSLGEIKTGQYFLTTEEGKTPIKTTIVDAPHVDGYLVKNSSEASKTVSLPHTNGGNLTSYGRTEVEFEFIPSANTILVTGIEVDKNNKPTGNLVYTEQKTGGQFENITITAKNATDTTQLPNWDLVGLANYDSSGDFTNISVGTNSKPVVFGTDTAVTFAYKRKMATVTVEYVDESGNKIGTSDTFELPLNSEYTFIAKSIDGYKLVNPGAYTTTKTITGETPIQIGAYTPIIETIRIHAKLSDGTILASDSIDKPIGSKNVEVSSSGLVTMLGNRYKLVSSSTVTVGTVKEDTDVYFEFKEQKTKVTVKYQDASGTQIAPDKTYEVFYDDQILENAISIKNYYADSTLAPVSVTKKADSATFEHIFKYKASKGAVTIMAKNSTTGEILSYHVENDVIGTSKSYTASSDKTKTDYFSGETFLENHKLSTGQTNPQTVTFSENHQTLVFNYDVIKYKVTIDAKDADGNSLNFFDGTSQKEFSYKQGSTYNIYAPPVTGYKIKEGTEYSTSNSGDANGITGDSTHTFIYEKINNEVNLTIKAVDDEGVLIKSIVVTGEREEEREFDILEGTNGGTTEGAYLTVEDYEKWKLNDTQKKKGTFGVDREVVFKFTRETVELTVNFVDSSNGDAEIATSVKHVVPTHSQYNVFARHIDNYQLAPGEEQIRTVDIATGNSSVNIKYVPKVGDVLVRAVDEEGHILESRYYDFATGTTFEFGVTPDTSLTDFSVYDAGTTGAYIYESIDKPSITVSDIASENVVILSFKKNKAPITVKYVDVDDESNELIKTKTYLAQYTTTIEEYAPNVDFYNLATDSYESYLVEGAKEIVFKYKKVDYSIVTDGVVNVIARNSENGNIINIVSFNETIGTQPIYYPKTIFGDKVTGYELLNASDETDGKSVVVDNGYVNIEFLYKPVGIPISVYAQAEDGSDLTSLMLPKEKQVSVQEGGNITVHAPHIPNYTVVGYKDGASVVSENSKTFTNVMSIGEVTFIYKPIGQLIVVKGIEVSESGVDTGNTVYVETIDGDQAKSVTATSKTLANWDLVGLYNGVGDISNGVSQKEVTYGVDKGVTFAYTRKTTQVTVNYVEDGTGKILGSNTYTLPINQEETFTAIPIDGYELKNKSAGAYSQTFTPNGSNSPTDFVYVKLQEGVVIEARLGSDTGTVLARSSKDYALGAEKVSVSSADLDAMINPRYILDTSVAGNTATKELDVVKKDSVVVFVYKEQTSTVTMNYLVTGGGAIPSVTSKTYTVPYGQTIRESARSIDDYYFDTTVANNNLNYSVVASQPTHTNTFYYKRAQGSISVIARDKTTGEILYYKNHNGTQGTNLTIDSATEFVGQGFMNYYTLNSGSSKVQTMPYTNTHGQMIFEYDKQTFTVNIKAVSNTGEELTFYDGRKVIPFTYTKGSSYTIYAPPVVGYQVKEGTPYVTTEKDGKDFTFTYSKIDIDENLSVKAVSSDGKYIIGTKIITGERSETDTIRIADYVNEIYNPDEWTLVGDNYFEATYGYDNEVVFTFDRKLVNVTVNHILETGSGDEVHLTKTEKVGTNTNYTSTAINIDNYQLKDTETFTKVSAIGTTDVIVNYRYIPIAGDVLIKAVDKDTGATLLVRGVVADVGSPYEVTSDILSSISDAVAPGYMYDTNSVITLDNVEPTLADNVITLNYTKRLSEITVKYVDQFGKPVFPESKYFAQYGTSINEYAVNVDFHNLTSTNSFVKIADVSEMSYEIVFEYRKVDYTIVTDGVVNVIAKVSDGNGGYKVLDFKSFNGTIGATDSFSASGLFNLVGYTLDDDDVKNATYVSGFVEVEFIYKISNLNVTIKAIDRATKAPLAFSEQQVIPVIEGGNITVYAPHISTYQINGSSFKELTNVTQDQTVTFEYDKIAVPSVIVVKHISMINGYNVSITSQTHSGNVGETLTVNPLSEADALALGYKINSNYDYTKTLKFGTEAEFIYVYDRIMSDLKVNHNVNIYSGGSITGKLTEADKLTQAPQLVNTVTKVGSGLYHTVIAPFESNYVIDTAKTNPPLRQSVQMDTLIKTIDYYYRNITGNILIRAVVEDPKGAIVINGKTYTALAQVDDDIVAGDSYNSVKAGEARKALSNLLDPSYAYSGLLEGNENFTMETGGNYLNHILTYEYTADYKDVEVYYYNSAGALLDPSLIAGVDTNPQVIRVIKGEYVNIYAPSVTNYNFIKSGFIMEETKARSARNSSVVADSDKAAYNEQILGDAICNIVFEEMIATNTVNVTLSTRYNGAPIGAGTSDLMTVVVGQTINAPFIEGYKPVQPSYTATSTQTNYVFDYTKIEKEVVHTSGDTSYIYVKGETVYVPSEIDYSGTAFTHNKYLNGYPDGTIGVDRQITRAEVVTMLYNILYDSKTDKKIYKPTTLTDIDQDQWYAEAVNYMVAKNYAKGYDDGTFKPQRNISRAELATILSNIFATTSNAEVNKLPLDPNGWATPYIVKAYSNGLYNGFDLYEYDFTALATRAEVIVMINNGTHRVPNTQYLSQFKAPVDLPKSHWAYYHVLEALYGHSGHYEGNFGTEREVIENSIENVKEDNAKDSIKN